MIVFKGIEESSTLIMVSGINIDDIFIEKKLQVCF